MSNYRTGTAICRLLAYIIYKYCRPTVLLSYQTSFRYEDDKVSDPTPFCNQTPVIPTDGQDNMAVSIGFYKLAVVVVRRPLVLRHIQVYP